MSRPGYGRFVAGYRIGRLVLAERLTPALFAAKCECGTKVNVNASQIEAQDRAGRVAECAACRALRPARPREVVASSVRWVDPTRMTPEELAAWKLADEESEWMERPYGYGGAPAMQVVTVAEVVHHVVVLGGGE